MAYHHLQTINGWGIHVNTRGQFSIWPEGKNREHEDAVHYLESMEKAEARIKQKLQAKRQAETVTVKQQVLAVIHPRYERYNATQLCPANVTEATFTGLNRTDGSLKLGSTLKDKRYNLFPMSKRAEAEQYAKLLTREAELQHQLVELELKAIKIPHIGYTLRRRRTVEEANEFTKKFLKELEKKS